jgi:hypothetical protein
MKDFNLFVAQQIVDYMHVNYPPNVLQEFVMYLGSTKNQTKEKTLLEQAQNPTEFYRMQNLAFAADMYEPWFYAMSGIVISIILSVAGWFYIIYRLLFIINN